MTKYSNSNCQSDDSITAERRATRWLRAVAIFCALVLPQATWAGDPSNLSAYYRVIQLPSQVSWTGPPVIDRAAPVPTGFPPEVHVVGGGQDPSGVVVGAETTYPAERLFAMAGYLIGGRPVVSAPITWFVGQKFDPCGTVWIWETPWQPLSTAIVRPRVGAVFELQRLFQLPSSSGCSPFGMSLTIETARWSAIDTITLKAPIRRKATDGSEYDASPMVQLRNGVPWMTYYFGYRMGLVGSQANWLDSNLPRVMPALTGWPAFPDGRDNFELAKLPAPYIEGEIVEYVNFQVSPGSSAGHYFYATGAAEQALLDGVESWSRTGKSFKSGGYVSVCRLFAAGTDGKSGTHFYSADAAECNQLKGLSFLQYEGEVFRASRPIPASSATAAATCPLGTVGLYRFYNNASQKSYANNHRYLIGRPYPSEGSAMVSVGWTDEGLQMCVPDAP